MPDGSQLAKPPTAKPPTIAIELSAEDWGLVRQMLSRGTAHLGAELAQTGSLNIGVALRLLAVVAAVDARLAAIVT